MNNHTQPDKCCHKVPLAIAAIPSQPWEEPYQDCKALRQGTIFPSLDLPFYITAAGGKCHE